MFIDDPLNNVHPTRTNTSTSANGDAISDGMMPLDLSAKNKSSVNEVTLSSAEKQSYELRIDGLIKSNEAKINRVKCLAGERNEWKKQAWKN